MSAIGPAESVRSLVEASREVIDVRVEAVGRYRSSVGRPFAELTERQWEVLLAAVESGYYEAPREATYAEIAEALDRSVSAVGQIRRRIESKLVYDAVPDRERDGVRHSLETAGDSLRFRDRAISRAARLRRARRPVTYLVLNVS